MRESVDCPRISLFGSVDPGGRFRQALGEPLELPLLLGSGIAAGEELVDHAAVELLPGAHLIERAHGEEQNAVVKRVIPIKRPRSSSVMIS